MVNTHVKLDVMSTLGKVKIRDLGVDAKPSTFSATITRSGDCISANIWIEDRDGRKFGLVIGHDALLSLNEAIVEELANVAAHPVFKPA